VLIAGIVPLIWLNWWMLAFWAAGLFALVGGRVLVFQSRWQRLHYQLMMVYLLAALLFWITPNLFELPAVGDATRNLMEFALPVLLLCMALVPHEHERVSKAQAVDFIYSIMLFMLLILLVQGSLVVMSQAGLDYFAALLRTVFIIALLLFLLGWLWSPRMGFSGLQPIFSRYFLNIGTPFEEWLSQLAVIAQNEHNPANFMLRAMDQLALLPWVSGLSWECEEGHGTLGLSSPHRIEVADYDLRLTLFSRQTIAPSVLVHIHLLIQLLGHFYQAKRREQSLREMARLQAVYETGARLTHDLKNMLQSMLALTSIAEQQSGMAQAILQKQLPVLAQRIELTLAKLKAPQLAAESATLPLSRWWENLRLRQHHREIEWQIEAGADRQPVPVALLDSVADNLIDNACNKLLREPGIRISVSLRSNPLRLSVCDSGSAIPAAVACQLLHTVVTSEDGLGVGLFQVARWAEQSGYHISLSENVAGAVCFELRQAGEGAS
jgi:signal transduction histidine kinase